MVLKVCKIEISWTEKKEQKQTFGKVCSKHQDKSKILCYNDIRKAKRAVLSVNMEGRYEELLYIR